MQTYFAIMKTCLLNVNNIFFQKHVVILVVLAWEALHLRILCVKQNLYMHVYRVFAILPLRIFNFALEYRETLVVRQT